MGKRLEMHLSTLNEGLRNHDPHIHRAEEMVILFSGRYRMHIGDQFYKGSTGDVYFLGSNVLHAIRNIGSSQCMYVAFQFE